MKFVMTYTEFIHKLLFSSSGIAAFFLVFVAFFALPPAYAQTCMPQRTINQHRCVSQLGICTQWASAELGTSCIRTSILSTIAYNNCLSECGPNCGTPYCINYAALTYSCQVQSFSASCSGPPACEAIANIISCDSVGSSCSERTESLTYQCYYNPPATSPPPPSGSCITGDCFTGIANCGVVGRSNGTGVCTGGICCVPNSGYVPNCPYDVSQTGYPSCKYSEGNGCNQLCCSNWNSVTNSCNVPPTCNGCADGLVGGGCLCPTCSINVSPNSTIVQVGQSVDLGLVESSNFPVNWRFRYTVNDIVSAQKIGNVVRLTGLAVGTTTVTIRGNWTGYSPRNICSDIIAVNVNVLPTATPSACGPMGAITGTQLNCAHSVTGNGVLRWRWQHVAGVTAYSISLSNTSGTVINPVQNILATSLNCSSGTCEHVTTGLNANSYVLTVKPSSGTCVVPVASTVSNPAAVAVCPVSRLSVVGKSVSSSASSCADVNASTTYANPLTFSFAPALAPVSQTQSGSSPVVWNNVPPTTYTLSQSAPADYSLQYACWTKTGGAPFTSGLSASAQSGETVTWQLGYVLGRAWAKVVGGDAVICTNVSSPIPASLGANRYFMTSATVGSPGIVYYGTDYDFDANVAQKGENYVSTTNWLANESGTAACTTNWYQFLLNKYGLATTAADMGGGIYNRNTFSSRAQPYKVSGNLTTQGTWNFNSDGENVVIFVEGNLTIGGEIRVPSRSFVSFVVQGNITVDPAVGGNVATNTPNIEGVYVTSGSFNTGVTNNNGSAKLIVNGIVIANSFVLQRDLDAQNANTTTPSEEFRYNPMYLLTLPNEFMDMKIKWEEVAP